MALQDLDRLQTQLLMTGLQLKNQPLFQLLNDLIKAIKQNQSSISASSSSGLAALADQDFLTHADDTPDLPNSRQLLAGDNVSFDDGTAGERTINVDRDEVILTGDNEVATLPNSRQLLAGTGIAFDDTVANQRTVSVSLVDQDYVLMSDGANPPNPMDDGAGNFLYVGYTP